MRLPKDRELLVVQPLERELPVPGEQSKRLGIDNHKWAVLDKRAAPDKRARIQRVFQHSQRPMWLFLLGKSLSS